MKVLYHDIVAAPPEIEARAAARRVGLDELLATSEYVTLHVPLDKSTRGLIDRAALAQMRPDAILINTCRGPVVVEEAVAEALDAGRLWGYGGNVFAVEPPPPDHPLIGRPDVLLTPHTPLRLTRAYGTWPTGSSRTCSGSSGASAAPSGQQPQARQLAAPPPGPSAALSIDTLSERLALRWDRRFSGDFFHVHAALAIAGRFFGSSVRGAAVRGGTDLSAGRDADARAGDRRVP